MTFLSNCDGYWCGPAHKNSVYVHVCIYPSLSLSLFSLPTLSLPLPFFSAQIISQVNGGETLTQYVPQCISFSAYPYNEIDEKDSDVDVDEDDDLLADGEGVPEDDTEEVEP